MFGGIQSRAGYPRLAGRQQVAAMYCGGGQRSRWRRNRPVKIKGLAGRTGLAGAAGLEPATTGFGDQTSTGFIKHLARRGASTPHLKIKHLARFRQPRHQRAGALPHADVRHRREVEISRDPEIRPVPVRPPARCEASLELNNPDGSFPWQESASGIGAQ